jgi:hypothetical protein
LSAAVVRVTLLNLVAAEPVECWLKLMRICLPDR